MVRTVRAFIPKYQSLFRDVPAMTMGIPFFISVAFFATETWDAETFAYLLGTDLSPLFL